MAKHAKNLSSKDSDVQYNWRHKKIFAWTRISRNCRNSCCGTKASGTMFPQKIRVFYRLHDWVWEGFTNHRLRVIYCHVCQHSRVCREKFIVTCAVERPEKWCGIRDRAFRKKTDRRNKKHTPDPIQPSLFEYETLYITPRSMAGKFRAKPGKERVQPRMIMLCTFVSL